MVKITVCFIDGDAETFSQDEFLNYAIKEELENPKCDFVRIGDNMFRKTEIKYIEVKREDN